MDFASVSSDPPICTTIVLMERNGLGEFEQLVLAGTTIVGNGYGITIHEELRQLLKGTHRIASLASVYTTLGRLEKKGYLRSAMGGATSERGGRSKRFYVVQPSGRKALESSLAVSRNMFNAYEKWLKLPVADTPIYDTITVPRKRHHR